MRTRGSAALHANREDGRLRRPDCESRTERRDSPGRFAASGGAIRPAAPRPPVRTCAGCGRKAQKGELARFTAPDGVLTPDPAAEAPGRGVYTCRTAACFERAAARHAFSRTLRTDARVPEGLNPFSKED